MTSPILERFPLGFPWATQDPFLFCVHHDDAYPVGDENMGPATSLAGRNMGQDFAGKDGWRMYHGLVVPGFPQHPHRGFETVTIVRRGYIDHSDSSGATARFGEGDVQWLTAGKGIVHSEMFPLLKRDDANPVELFQIWLNLPASDKLVDPYFSMLWSKDIPQREFVDAKGRKTVVTMIAGALDGAAAPKPPPNSWASREDAQLVIWCLKLEPHATWRLPAANPDVSRTLYYFVGNGLSVEGARIEKPEGLALSHDQVTLTAGDAAVECLLLQAKPIGEPVAQHGPFVMNTRAEIQQAFHDYQQTRFGGWPWPKDDPVHPREQGRFAQHADGRVERP